MKCPHCGKDRPAPPPGKYLCTDCQQPMIVDAAGHAKAYTRGTGPGSTFAGPLGPGLGAGGFGAPRPAPGGGPFKMDISGLLAGTRRDIGGGQILLTSADGFDGYEITDYRGMAWGVSMRSKDLGQDCAMGCKQVTGGELHSYTQLADESRQRCIDRMLDMAARMNANAVINVRFDLSMSQSSSSLVTVNGTAVVIKPVKNYVPTGALGNIVVELVNVTANRK